MTDLGDRRIWPALAREVDSTFALLTTSDRMLAEMRHLSLDLDPFFACFSAGAERFLKLVHGLATYDKTGAWPSQDEMSKELSHAITKLDALCQQHVKDGLHLATSRRYIEQLLAVAQCRRSCNSPARGLIASGNSPGSASRNSSGAASRNAS